MRVLLRDVLVPSAVTVIAIAGLLVAALVTATPRSETLVVLFPPWWATARALEAAASAGRVVAVGRIPASLVVAGDAAVLGRALRAAGALLLLDASLPAGCHAPAPEPH